MKKRNWNFNGVTTTSRRRMTTLTHSAAAERNISPTRTTVIRRKTESTSSDIVHIPEENEGTSSNKSNENSPDDEDSGISEIAGEETVLILEHGANDDIKCQISLCYTFLQIFFPFLIAGAGMMLAGILLDYVQHYKVFQDIPELYILVPALLGLKGNLEMTLASRLSTASNLGHMNGCSSRWLLIWGNLTLIQGQALVVAFIATVTSVMLSLIGGEHLHPNHIFLIGGSSMSAACIASFLLSSVMIIIVILSRPLNINPDNVATPIAASLGDLVTLCILSGIAIALFRIKNETVLISCILCGVLIVLIPIWVSLAYCNHTTRPVLYSGWIPVLSAMFISSMGGLVLSKTVLNFPGIAIYSPIINGMGGNLAAVQASRICTHLHLSSTAHRSGDNSSPTPQYQWSGIIGTFWKGNHSKTSSLLLSMVIPASALFLMLIRYIKAGHTTLSVMFFFSYLLVAIAQAAILLIVTDWLVHFIYHKLNMDPDNIAIPFITALGDFLGTGLLAAAFHILWLFGDKDSDVGE
jgi:solute carrier family 41